MGAERWRWSFSETVARFRTELGAAAAAMSDGSADHSTMDAFQKMMNDMEANDVFGGRSRAPAEGTEERRQAKREPAETVEELHQQTAAEFDAFAK